MRKFICVAVFNGPNLRHLDIVKAHEDVVAELKVSGLDCAVIRPTVYFSDMSEYLEMAKKGRGRTLSVAAASNTRAMLGRSIMAEAWRSPGESRQTA